MNYPEQYRHNINQTLEVIKSLDDSLDQKDKLSNIYRELSRLVIATITLRTEQIKNVRAIGRPIGTVDPNSDNQTKPWLEQNISRSTYYNRKRKNTE